MFIFVTNNIQYCQMFWQCQEQLIKDVDDDILEIKTYGCFVEDGIFFEVGVCFEVEQSGKIVRKNDSFYDENMYYVTFYGHLLL